MNTFLDSGLVYDSLDQPASIDFRTKLTLTALAKSLAGIIVGLVTLRSSRCCGRAAGWAGEAGLAQGRRGAPIACTRSCSAWADGSLPFVIVMTTVPGVALDDEPLVALSMGLPIGLGIYLAWVHRAWSTTTKARGFGAVVAGALVGAWLGFHVTDGLLALHDLDRRSGRRCEPDPRSPSTSRGIGRLAIASS